MILFNCEHIYFVAAPPPQHVARSCSQAAEWGINWERLRLNTCQAIWGLTEGWLCRMHLRRCLIWKSVAAQWWWDASWIQLSLTSKLSPQCLEWKDPWKERIDIPPCTPDPVSVARMLDSRVLRSQDPRRYQRRASVIVPGAPHL